MKQTKIWDTMPLLILESRETCFTTQKKHDNFRDSRLFGGGGAVKESFVQEKSLVESPNVKSDFKKRWFDRNEDRELFRPPLKYKKSLMDAEVPEGAAEPSLKTRLPCP